MERATLDLGAVYAEAVAVAAADVSRLMRAFLASHEWMRPWLRCASRSLSPVASGTREQTQTNVAGTEKKENGDESGATREKC